MDSRAHKNIHIIYIKGSCGESAGLQQTQPPACLVSTDSKREITDSLTSAILKISGKRAKKDHTGRDTADFLGYPPKDSLSTGVQPGLSMDKPLNEECYSQSKTGLG